MSYKITITYCAKCRWLLRSSWMAQELLSTFEAQISELTLVPSSGGIFEIKLQDQLIWSRKEMGGFPEIAQLKQLVRDIIAPEMQFSCIDKR